MRISTLTRKIVLLVIPTRLMATRNRRVSIFNQLLLPRARQMLSRSPPAQRGDWQSLLLPLLAVVGFVLLLMKLV